jgi:hypothetical protein
MWALAGGTVAGVVACQRSAGTRQSNAGVLSLNKHMAAPGVLAGGSPLGTHVRLACKGAPGVLTINLGCSSTGHAE